MIRPFCRSEVLARRLDTPFELISALETQERAAWLADELAQSKLCRRVVDLRVIEPEGGPWVDMRQSASASAMERIENLSRSVPIDAIEVPLVGQNALLVQRLRALVADLGDTVVLDYSCIPERVLFPLVRLLLQAPIRTLAGAYTQAGRYTSGPLASDVGPSEIVPMFHASFLTLGSEPYAVVLSLGFDAPGVASLVADFCVRGGTTGASEVSILFPHPSSPPMFQRNWDALRAVEAALGSSAHSRSVRVASHAGSPGLVTHVVATDVGGVFDLLMDGRIGNRVLMPFGPKPISLAMALYACSETRRERSAVAISQAAHLHPRAGESVAVADGVGSSLASVIRFEGRSFFS